jgi:Tfp pilus assembly protein PilV
MRIPRGSGRAEGFTLIEVMITMFFITFIVQTLAMVSLYAQKSSTYARRLTSANIIAEQTMETYRNTAYANLIDEDADVQCFDGFMTPAACNARAVFTRTTGVTVDTPMTNVTEVDVTVTWYNGEYQARLVSYLSKW